MVKKGHRGGRGGGGGSRGGHRLRSSRAMAMVCMVYLIVYCNSGLGIAAGGHWQERDDLLVHK